MKLVAKYTVALGSAFIVVLSLLAYVRVAYTRDAYERDMARDHVVVGSVLQAGIVDVWLDAGDPKSHERATRETIALVQRANTMVGTTRFEWTSDPAAAEMQQVEGHELVSRFPVRVGSSVVGSVVARESMDDIDDAVHTEVLLSVVGIVVIVVIGLLSSLVMGAWLVSRPITLLIQQARRIGRRELSCDLAFSRRDELGELAVEMNAASRTLGDAIAATAAETEARIKAVEQLRHSDRLSTVGKLAAGVAHELGTPLSVIGGHAQMIAEGEVTGDAALHSARTIDHEVTRMGKIVRQLLDFARRKGPEGSTSEPNEITRRCVSLLAVMAERATVRCEVEVTTPVRALIDEDSLQQVLTNLIVNAIQAMPGGGLLRVGVARVRTAAPESTTSPTACVRIDIADTGGGIAPEVKAHMFEPFFTTKAPGDGTGLGLAVVHGIVVDHGGWIAIDTSAKGTTFSVYFQEEPS